MSIVKEISELTAIARLKHAERTGINPDDYSNFYEVLQYHIDFIDCLRIDLDCNVAFKAIISLVDERLEYMKANYPTSNQIDFLTSIKDVFNDYVRNKNLVVYNLVNEIQEKDNQILKLTEDYAKIMELYISNLNK